MAMPEDIDIRPRYEERKKTQSYLDNFIISLREIMNEFKETQIQQALSSAIEKLEALQKAHSTLGTDDTAAKKERSQIMNILKEAQTANTLPSYLAALIETFTLDIAAIDFNTRRSRTIIPDARDAILQQDAENIYRFKQQWESQVTQLLKRKNLSPTLFSIENRMSFNEPIENHAAWAFNFIYDTPYPEKKREENFIARLIHGIQHVSRAALYIPVFANLYRKHGDLESQKLTETDIKLLQIAALFHDSAREDEGEDRWDHESAIFLYCYLTRILGINQDKAKLIAEATANKDPNKKGYFTIIDSDTITWQWNEARNEKNIYQRLLHDADCLDIIRARDTFDATYLDFHKEFQSNPLAVEEMAKLITESRSLIDIEGDTRDLIKPEIKKRYENENAYLETRNALDKRHPLLIKLNQRLYTSEELQKINLADTSPYDPKAGLTEENMRAAIREGRVFSRGVSSPSAITEKKLKNLRSHETFAETEVRKTLRRTTVPTRTRKENNIEKEGNPNRSVSMIGYGSPVFCNAGFLIVDPILDDIATIDKIDSGTGRFKKELLKQDLLREKLPSNDEKTKKLEALHERLKLGGSSISFGGFLGVSRHNEIICHIKNYDAIYFSNDPNLFNSDLYYSREITHIYAPRLEAIFLRNEYEKATHKKLPVFEYSSTHNTVRKVPEEELTRENIKKMWVCMCSDYMKEAFLGGRVFIAFEKIFDAPIQDIKTLSMYSLPFNHYAYNRKNSPADSNYEKAFQDEISKAIQEERNKLISEYETKIKIQIRKGELSPLSDKAFFVLSRNPALVEELRTEITQTIRSFDAQSKPLSYGDISFFFSDANIRSSNKRHLQLVNAYTLAKKLNLAQETEKIRALVSELIYDKIGKLNTGNIEYFLEREELFNVLSFFEILENYQNIKIEIEKISTAFLTTEKDRLISKLGVDFEKNLYGGSYFLLKYQDYVRLIRDLSDKEMLKPDQKEEAREFLSKMKEALGKYSTAGFMPETAIKLLKEVDDLSHSLNSNIMYLSRK